MAIFDTQYQRIDVERQRVAMRSLDIVGGIVHHLDRVLQLPISARRPKTALLQLLGRPNAESIDGVATSDYRLLEISQLGF